jgi:hypothetical protein
LMSMSRAAVKDHKMCQPTCSRRGRGVKAALSPSELQTTNIAKGVIFTDFYPCS